LLTMADEKKSRLLGFITGKIVSNGKPPTIAQMMKAVDSASEPAVAQLLRALRADGSVTWVPRKYETLQLVEKGPTKMAAPGAAKLQGRRVRKSKGNQFALDDRPAPPAPKPTSDLLASAAILLQPGELVRVRGLVDAARAACDELETMIAMAEKSPTIGGLLRGTLDRALGLAAPGPASALGLWPEATSEVVPIPVPKRSTSKRSGAKRTARKVPDLVEPPIATDPAEDLEVEDEPAPASEPPASSRRSSDKPFRVENAKGHEMGEGFDTLTDAQHFCRRNSDAARICRNSDDKIMPRVG